MPGLIGVILTMTMTMFTAVAIVRERERGNLELLINTPVTSAELMVGKVLPYIFLGLVQLAVILTVGKLLKQKNATVKGFQRLVVGEGIEKKQENFAEEVMQQVSGN